MAGARRGALARAAFTAMALAVAASSPAQEERSGETPAALVLQAEADLARGEVIRAIESFERVTRMGHSTDAEMGLVRAYMQDGQYRRALAFCAHVAAEHRDVQDAAVLYAELLRAGGQEEVAKSVIAQATKHAPSNRLVVAATRAGASPPMPDGDLFRPPHRLAPFELSIPGQDSIPGGARVASSGVLLPDGGHAIVPAAAIIVDGRLVGRLWVRDGLGRTREAEVDGAAPVLKPSGAIVLRLRGQLAQGAGATIVTRPPFDGSPAYVIEYSEGRPAGPAWPRLRTGFFAAVQGATGRRSLGTDFDASSQGGAVLDASGGIAGMVLRDPDSRAMVLPVSLWPADAGAAAAEAPRAPMVPASASAPSRRLPADAIYEQALRLALQVIVAP